MFKDDTYLEAMMARYKLGLDLVLAEQPQMLSLSLHPSRSDRFLFSLGKIFISLGSRLQQRYTLAAPKTYRSAYPTG